MQDLVQIISYEEERVNQGTKKANGCLQSRAQQPASVAEKLYLLEKSRNEAGEFPLVLSGCLELGVEHHNEVARRRGGAGALPGHGLYESPYGGAHSPKTGYNLIA